MRFLQLGPRTRAQFIKKTNAAGKKELHRALAAGETEFYGRPTSAATAAQPRLEYRLQSGGAAQRRRYASPSAPSSPAGQCRKHKQYPIPFYRPIGLSPGKPNGLLTPVPISDSDTRRILPQIAITAQAQAPWGPVGNRTPFPS